MEIFSKLQAKQSLENKSLVIDVLKRPTKLSINGLVFVFQLMGDGGWGGGDAGVRV